MLCDTVMNDQVLYMLPDDSAQQAALIMLNENIGFLPVCDEEGRVIGAVTDRDLALRVCANGTPSPHVRVGEVMTHDPVTCRPDDQLAHAEHLMAQFGKSRIIITDDAMRLVGVISLADVVTRDSNKHAAHTLRKIVEREYRF